MAILATRVISGKGVLRLDVGSTDYKRAKVFTLYADVIRKPSNEYLNFNYNPPESRYATLQFIRGGYVIKTEPLKYPKQSWDFYFEPSAQAMFAVQCAYQGILQSFVNLGTALNVVPVSVVDNIADWVHVDLMWDEVKVVCYADTAIQLSVRTKEFDLCPDQQTKEPDPPPPPPEDPPAYDPGEPLADTASPASPAYDENTDNGDTVPYPGDLDLQPEFPTGEVCELLVVSYVVNRVNRNTGAVVSPLNLSNQMYGEIEGYRIQKNPTNDQLFFTSRGLRVFGSEPCGASPSESQVLVTGDVIVSIEIVSINPV